MPKLIKPLHRDEVFEVLGPFVMAAGAASLAFKSDIIENRFYNDSGQDIPPKRERGRRL